MKGKVAGEIDIDSHDLAAFTSVDRIFLEEVAGVVSSYIEAHLELAGKSEKEGAVTLSATSQSHD